MTGPDARGSGLTDDEAIYKKSDMRSRVSKAAKFLSSVYKERTWLRSLMASPNYVLIKDFLPGHFYSPIPDLADIRKRARTLFDPAAVDVRSIDINEHIQVVLMSRFAALYSEMPFPDEKSERYRYFFDNPYFSFGDGVILYSFLRHFRPRRVIEVGSGFSSAEMLDVDELFLSKKTEFTFVEPYPDRLLSLLSARDTQTHTIDARPVQEVDLNTFLALEENDILFIDSSHVAKIGSDVLHIVFYILPLLKKGVIVHFHDILWPFEYPENWIEEGRVWSEAYFVRAFLQYNSAFEILFFNSYMALRYSQEIELKMPRILAPPCRPETLGNSSLWLRKVV
jgi:hypothetical protein